MFILAILLFTLLPLSRKLKTIATASLLFFVIFYGGMIGFQSVTERFLAFWNGAQGRFLLWLDSLSILKDHLVTGSGMGTYKFLSPVYLKNLSDTILYDFAHNEYVELTIELGLPVAILLFLSIVWKIFQSGAKIVKTENKLETFPFFTDNSIIAIGSFCAIVGFLLHGFVDFVWRLPVNALYAVTLIAMLSSSFSSEEIDEK